VDLSRYGSGPGSSTLPLVVFSSVPLGLNPEVNALATILVVTVAADVILAALIVRRGRRA